ncbi:hypothetical protein GCK32_005997 [Trichostrongylus colubriformis]|uniref:LRAT domain-containing protein n=1 Tax=Trichostrongylus colubriformis TaxID=6319 RepID=A0AAN8IX19_TRICO
MACRSAGDAAASIPDFVHVPALVTEFYRYAASRCPNDPCSALQKLNSAQLVGLFDLLDGTLSKVPGDPKMFFIPSSACYFSFIDIPNSEDGLVVYVSNEDRFPKIEVVGNRMEHAIVHLAGKTHQAVDPFLPKSSNVASLRQQMKTVCSQRNKKKLGKAPSGAGLWVEMDNDVGYRPVPEDAVKIKKALDLLCSNDSDESLRQCKMQWLMELVTFAQIATDECDFGMGLELGQWLFLANHELLDKLAYRLLATAYSLLGRQEYKKILDLQMAPGVRRRNELDARKKSSMQTLSVMQKIVSPCSNSKTWSHTIKIVPLGAGQDVGRSCILVTIGGKNVMLDCGMHMGYQDERRFPDFSYIGGGGKLNDYLTCVIVSHFHLDHCGSLPHMSEILIRDCQPRSVMFVHGEAAKMEFLKGKVEKEFRIPVLMPANGESVTIPGITSLEVDVPQDIVQRCLDLDPTPSKKACPFSACLVMDKQNGLEVITCEAAASRLQLGLHTITLSQLVKSRSAVDWRALSEALSIHDTHLQHKQDGIELFHGEICVLPVKGDESQASDKTHHHEMLPAGQLIGEWLSAEEIVPHVQLGDLLEFRRVTSIGGAPRAIYTHWALYIGRHEDLPLVVHLSGGEGDFDKGSKLDSLSSGPGNVIRACTAQVRCDPLLAVAGEDLLRINNAHDVDHQPFPPRIVVERAVMQLGSGNYNIFLNNCEHFVKWCRYGNRISGQAVAFKSLLLGSALSVAGAPFSVAVGAGFAFLTLATPLSKLINRYYRSDFSLF